MNPMTPAQYRLHLLCAISRAQNDGFTNYAAALVAIYRKEFPAV